MEQIMPKNNSKLIKYIGIDPGKGGGIAMLQGRTMKVNKCPATIDDMSMIFALLIGDTPPSNIRVIIEKVWARPTDGKSSIFTFAQNYGNWEGIISSHEIKTYYVTPKVWIKSMGCPPKLSKKDRKNHLKELAKKKYPKVAKKIILATADAVLLADYGKNIAKIK